MNLDVLGTFIGWYALMNNNVSKMYLTSVNEFVMLKSLNFSNELQIRLNLSFKYALEQKLKQWISSVFKR